MIRDSYDLTTVLEKLVFHPPRHLEIQTRHGHETLKLPDIAAYQVMRLTGHRQD